MLLLVTQINGPHAPAVTDPQKQCQYSKLASSFGAFVLPVTDKRRELKACSPSFPRKIRIKLCNPSSINTSEQSSIKRGSIQDQKRRTRPRKSRIPPLSPLVKQELENKESSLFLLLSLPSLVKLFVLAFTATFFISKTSSLIARWT
ncbi:hypothetical protein AXF42_Ash012289 [Apostasia shenzhenica]|uniref:Uncharacterized protein n=1 Tax=Apostasia shenzhenica TaxID=1088818 RepID=A0A2I0B4I2_9ASPA|nr:hypothetical protein AXF42_Ash012289 [Apostasia shenzhenica]